MELQQEVDVTLRSRVKKLLEGLSEGLYEREQPMNLAFLTAVAGESIFLLGPPGVGKSLIARRLKFAFRDGISFEYLMSKFSTPDEIFGPISIKKLKEEDQYERLTERYLPGANIVFLDEIWKAGPAIQNALLTILNEKIYRNGAEDIDVNIRGIITASNELPPRNQSLEPIWDRFLLRLEIGNIKKRNQFVQMIVDTRDVYKDEISDDLKLTNAELDQWSGVIDQVEVPAEVLNTIQLITAKIDEYNSHPNHADNPIKIYDRRWKKVVRLIRTSAFLNGRKKVDLMDCFLMEHCLWNFSAHREVIREMLIDAIRKHGYTMVVNLQNLKKEVADFEADVKQETQVPYVSTVAQLMPINEKFYKIDKKVNQFKGNMITIEQFRKLSLEDYQVTNYYDEAENLINRIKTKRGLSENTIDVSYSDTIYTFPLVTQQKESTEIIFKQPHKVITSFWDERLERLNKYIAAQQAKISENAPSEMNHLTGNLFVDPERAEIVRSNLEEVKAALENLSLRLEKLAFSYQKEN